MTVWHDGLIGGSETVVDMTLCLDNAGALPHFHNVADASFLPSSAAVNPALTVAAQALRVADHIVQSGFAV